MSTKTLSLSDQIKELTGQAVEKCYQCGKCSAGCPLAPEMDISPNQIIHMLQLDFENLYDKVLRSFTIWLCLTCETCYSRCPKEVDLPKIMEFLREESLRQNKVNPKARKIVQFHKAFLDGIKHTGRLYEVGLISDYKLRSGAFLQDLLVAPKMFFRGKLNPLPHRIKGRNEIAKIFKKTHHKKDK